MKRLLIVLTGCLLATSCEETNLPLVPEPIQGVYKITGSLVDPGDGNLIYTTANSSQTIYFKADGTFEANFNLCADPTDGGTGNRGTVDYELQILTPEGCHSRIWGQVASYELINGELRLSRSCIETCIEIYELANPPLL